MRNCCLRHLNCPRTRSRILMLQRKVSERAQSGRSYPSNCLQIDADVKGNQYSPFSDPLPPQAELSLRAGTQAINWQFNDTSKIEMFCSILNNEATTLQTELIQIHSVVDGDKLDELFGVYISSLLITNNRCGNADISKQLWKLNAIGNPLLRKFNFCPTDIMYHIRKVCMKPRANYIKTACKL